MPVNRTCSDCFVLINLSESGSSLNIFSSILFLTDGDAADVTDLIRSRNTADIDATIFSYTLGNEFIINTTVPQSVAEVTGGIYTHINDGDENLLTAMSSYYLYYAYGDAQHNDDMVLTSPYLDYSTGQSMITMSLPVYFQDYFIGVVGTDIPLSFLSEAIGDVVLARKSYSFLVNQENELILHPLLSSPGNPVFVGDLEPKEFDFHAMQTAFDGTQKIKGSVLTPVCSQISLSISHGL